jgi:hypothetical protein
MKCYSDGLNGVLLLLGVCIHGKYAEEKGRVGVYVFMRNA